MPGQRKKAYGLGKSTQRIELELPSGNTCLVTRPGVQGLIKVGILDSLDSLTATVQREHLDPNDPKAMRKAVSDMASRPEDLLQGMEMIDKVICHVVTEPRVSMPPESEQDRDAEVLYIDEVDTEDKMFIFQFVVGGTRDIESFRAEQQKLMGSFSAGQDLQLPA